MRDRRAILRPEREGQSKAPRAAAGKRNAANRSFTLPRALI
jgi:hypothetical protein